MDLSSIAQAAIAILGPCLPYLLKLGDKAAEEGAKKIGADTWILAKSLWSKLLPRLKDSPAVHDAAVELAASPNDLDLQATLRVQFRKLLARDEQFAADVRAFLTDAEKAPGNRVKASGERAIAVGGNVAGSSLSTGDAKRR
ncbi:hypothetical protein D621_14965 [beta proteobacterium AAP51]|nr:hypothetical protein D621_14965 [beta proteobacterium AAP51]